jgi:hypothetical protein
MSAEHEARPHLKFNLLFVKIEAEGEPAIKAASRPVLALASAVALSTVILALSRNFPVSLATLFSLAKSFKGAWY